MQEKREEIYNKKGIDSTPLRNLIDKYVREEKLKKAGCISSVKQHTQKK